MVEKIPTISKSRRLSRPAPASATGKKAYSSRKARDFMDDQSEEEANYAVTENNNN